MSPAAGTVLIGGRPYRWAAEPLPAGGDARACVAVREVGGRLAWHYHVTAFADGRVECDCWDALRRRNDRGELCKHGAALVAAGVITLSSEVYG